MKITLQNIRTIISTLLFFLFLPKFCLGIQLKIENIEAEIGKDIKIPIILDYQEVSPNITAISTDITFNTSILENPSAEIGESAKDANKDLVFSLIKENIIRIGIFGLNQNIIQGGIVCYLNFHVKEKSNSDSTVLINNPTATDSEGNKIEIIGENGIIVIRGVNKIIPQVISVFPENHATSVPTDTIIWAIFNKDIDSKSINKNTFILKIKDSEKAITGDVSYDILSRKAFLIPESNLEYNTTYIAILKKNIEDNLGNQLESDYIWEFTTEEVPVPLNLTMVLSLIIGIILYYFKGKEA